MHVTDSTQLSPRLSRQPLHVSLEGARAADEGRLLERCLERARDALLAKQNAKGYWVGELQGDSILESEYILLKWILGQEDDQNLPPISNFLRSLQNADGGWSLYPGGPADLSGTVKGYFSLKLRGDDPNAPHMRMAR